MRSSPCYKFLILLHSQWLCFSEQTLVIYSIKIFEVCSSGSCLRVHLAHSSFYKWGNWGPKGDLPKWHINNECLNQFANLLCDTLRIWQISLWLTGLWLACYTRPYYLQHAFNGASSVWHFVRCLLKSPHWIHMPFRRNPKFELLLSTPYLHHHKQSSPHLLSPGVSWQTSPHHCSLTISSLHGKQGRFQTSFHRSCFSLKLLETHQWSPIAVGRKFIRPTKSCKIWPSSLTFGHTPALLTTHQLHWLSLYSWNMPSRFLL